MLERAKNIAHVILTETTAPAAMLLSHKLRGALADLAAELIEVNQRLALLEQPKGGDDGIDREKLGRGG